MSCKLVCVKSLRECTFWSLRLLLTFFAVCFLQQQRILIHVWDTNSCNVLVKCLPISRWVCDTVSFAVPTTHTPFKGSFAREFRRWCLANFFGLTWGPYYEGPFAFGSISYKLFSRSKSSPLWKIPGARRLWTLESLSKSSLVRARSGPCHFRWKPCLLITRALGWR